MIDKFQTLFVLIAMSYLAHSQDIRDDLLFENIGKYKQGPIEKTLYVPRHMKAEWYLTRPICKAHGLDILTIKTLDEFEKVAGLCEDNKRLFGAYVYIGGATTDGRSPGSWYWVDNNERVSYAAPWKRGQPDNAGKKEYCLSLARNDEFKFNDIPCHGSWKETFICESARYVG